MAETKIEWTDLTWNPTRGCSRISPGCGGAKGEGGCYAEKVAHRFSGPGAPYDGLVRIGKQGPRWTGKVVLADKLAEPLSWKKPARIFVNSMSDLFHESLTDEEIAAVFGVMAAAPQHTFQVLTKRAERMRQWFALKPPQGLAGYCADVAVDAIGCGGERAVAVHDAGYGADWPLPNVHLGVSVEDQQRADERIPHLLATPAAVRFLSVEPLLGPVDFRKVPGFNRIGLDLSRWWVIVGGESGHGARPCSVEWIRSIVEQCKAARVPVFCKQLGANPVIEFCGECGHSLAEHDDVLPSPCHHDRTDPMALDPREKGYGCACVGFVGMRPLRDRKGGAMDEWPADLRVREMPAVAR